MRKFLFTILLLLAGYVGYMYFFGQGEDKSKAQTIVRETKDLGKAVGDFLRRQKDKYDDGDFNQVIDRVEKSLEKVKTSASKKDAEVKNDLLELRKELKQIDPQRLNEENRKALQKLIDDVDQQLKE
jgi:flagellar basal body-associated protein FliL